MGYNMTVLSSSVVSAVPVHPQKMPSKSKKPKICSTCNLTTPVAREFRRTCEFFDLHKELVPYADAWSWQKNIVKQRKLLIEREEDNSDTLIILQHKPVYTLGTGSSDAYLKFDMKNAPFDLFRTERGGEVTYHGPGQLVMYPIINLRYHMMDLHWYLRALEEVIIRAVSSSFSIKASRINGLTGVWVGDIKLAAVGIKVSQWITYHGLALNVTTDLKPFHQIVPCGIRDRQVGSIKELLWDNVMSPNGCEGENSDCFIAIEEEQQLIDMTCESLVREFCEVFQFDLQLRPVPVGISGAEATGASCLLLQ